MLYKYLSPARVDVLKNLRIRFTQPLALNDPFECRVQFTLGPELAQLRQQVEASCDALLQDFLNQDGLSEKDKRSAMASAVRAKARVAKSLARKDATGHPEISEQLLVMLSQRIGVLSLSSDRASALMWTHYADEHRGFAIGLDERHEFFHLPDMTGEVSNPRPVRYQRERPLIRASDDMYEALMCTKSLPWSDEQEVRVFRRLTGAMTTNGKDRAGFPVCLFELPANGIREVVYGARCDKTLIAEIEQSLVGHGMHEVKRFRAAVSRIRYEIDVEEVPASRAKK